MALAKFVLPTGYEADQRSIDAKHKLAEKMQALGLNPDEHMQSWLQVLGHVAQTGVGVWKDKQATKAETALDARKQSDYTTQLGEFAKLTGAKSPDLGAITDYVNNHPMMETPGKPFVSAREAQLKESGEHVYGPKGWTTKGEIAPGSFKPSDPGDAVIRDGNGNIIENKVATTVALKHQGWSGPDGYPMTTSMPDPNFSGQPPMPPVPPQDQLAPMPPQQDNSIPQGSQLTPPPSPIAAAMPQGSPMDYAHAIAQTESMNKNFQADGRTPLVSPKGARYAMQVMPATAHHPGYGLDPVHDESPAEYNRLGVQYADKMREMFGDRGGAAAYNGGPGRYGKALAQGGDPLSHMPAETRAYVPQVMGHMSGGRAAPPVGVVDGKPVWSINGKLYDNPEGQ